MKELQKLRKEITPPYRINEQSWSSHCEEELDYLPKAYLFNCNFENVKTFSSTSQNILAGQTRNF